MTANDVRPRGARDLRGARESLGAVSDRALRQPSFLHVMKFEEDAGYLSPARR